MFILCSREKIQILMLQVFRFVIQYIASYFHLELSVRLVQLKNFSSWS